MSRVRFVHPEDVARRVSEGKAPAAGIVVQLRLDSAAGCQDARQCSVRVAGSDEGQDAAVAATGSLLGGQPTEFLSWVPGVLNSCVVGSIVGEGPAERLPVEDLGCVNVVNG